MFAFDLFDYERDYLVQPCLFWLRKESPEDIDRTYWEIKDVFYQWRDAQADENGMVSVNVNALAAYAGLLSGKPDMKKFPAHEKEPLEVAGPLVRDDIELAFKIWLDGFDPFGALIRRRGIEQVFSIIGLYSKTAASRSSLVNVNHFLTQNIIQYAKVVEGLAEDAFKMRREHRAQLDAIRPKAAAEKKVRAQEKRRRVRETAIQLFTENPVAKLRAVANRIVELEPTLGSPASIEKLIVGTQAEARKLLAR